MATTHTFLKKETKKVLLFGVSSTESVRACREEIFLEGTGSCCWKPPQIIILFFVYWELPAEHGGLDQSELQPGCPWWAAASWAGTEYVKDLPLARVLHWAAQEQSPTATPCGRGKEWQQRMISSQLCQPAANETRLYSLVQYKSWGSWREAMRGRP